MTTTLRTSAGLLACALCLSAPFLTGAAVLGEERGVTLKGCLVKGDGDAGYLLSNAPAEPDWQRSGDSKIQPGTVGTTGGFESVFYWLEGDNDLGNHVGHQVEVRGDLKGDLADGEIKLNRKDAWTEMTVKSDGRTMKATVPNASLFPAPHDDK
ncbi:MAG TPA: hypothetical protein VM032_13040, partial [Vicinamibacterales bacterium]|nr:hypothetical protein [Vicinamibacterales bacterium]